MSALSGGEILIRTLDDLGIRLLFGYPGGAALHVYDALFRQDTVEHVLVRHEQAATHMADGYARATGKIGAVLVTSGPGATNTITGIATAYMDSIPMLVISTQVATHLIGTDSFQETDMIGVSRPVVKHSFMVKDVTQIATVVREAFHIATTGRPGPVVVDIPKDVTDPTKRIAYQATEKISMRSYKYSSDPKQSQIDRAAKILSTAKKPMIYSGGGVIQADASMELRALAKTLDCPVTNTLMGLGAYPASDKRFVGMLGMHGYYEANMAMHHCDVLLGVGVRFDDRITNTPNLFCPNAKIIHIDIDDSCIGKIIPVDAPVLGCAKIALKMLNDTLVKAKHKTDTTDWWKTINGWREEHGLLHKPRYRQDDNVIMPQRVIQTLFKVSKGEAWVSSDVGQHQMFAAQYYGFDKPRRWINSGGLGTMGFGLPAAMGAQFANLKDTVVCITGEGSIQMMLQELSTCKQYRLPIKIINLNNQALGMVKQWQDMQYGGRYSHSTYQDSLPDFVALAKSYGHTGIKVSRADKLESEMRRCFEMKDKLVFMDIDVDPGEHVYPMLVAPGGSMRDMWINKDERT
jgi:acetolactate synthase-1/2/3 large subunit